MTERTRADAALRKSEADLREREEQLRLATEAAEVGLWDLDLVSDALYWPARVKAMFGISSGVAVSMADFYSRHCIQPTWSERLPHFRRRWIRRGAPSMTSSTEPSARKTGVFGGWLQRAAASSTKEANASG